MDWAPYRYHVLSGADRSEGASTLETRPQAQVGQGGQAAHAPDSASRGQSVDCVMHAIIYGPLAQPVEYSNHGVEHEFGMVRRVLCIVLWTAALALRISLTVHRGPGGAHACIVGHVIPLY